VETAIRGFLRSREQAEMLARSAAAAFEATKVEEKIFSERKADVNRMYTLWSALLQEKDNLAIAQGNVALNLINVYRALGGGWEIRYETDAEAEGHNLPAPAPIAPTKESAALQAPNPIPPAKPEEERSEPSEVRNK